MDLRSTFFIIFLFFLSISDNYCFENKNKKPQLIVAIVVDQMRYDLENLSSIFRKGF